MLDRPPSVRRATPADIEQITTIIELVFAKDPLWSRALGALTPEQRRPFWRLFVEGTQVHGLLFGGTRDDTRIPVRFWPHTCGPVRAEDHTRGEESDGLIDGPEDAAWPL
ncbi:MAG: hypothetical protein M3R48_04860 [Candidatus Dormibacteraeota bacterium]|nr:hypothetical protein [Candidatus Dormibacteraeota bacterium]